VEKALSFPEEAWHQDEALQQQITANMQKIPLLCNPFSTVFFGRGLCGYRDDIIIAGSSPLATTAWDFRAAAQIKSVNIQWISAMQFTV
tara:strand:- start:428 stop:694 length:267 start_codon:yes stop_codon:yes gene_type:complete